jgi:hypothetical protein
MSAKYRNVCILAQQHVIAHALQSLGLVTEQIEAIAPLATQLGVVVALRKKAAVTAEHNRSYTSLGA